MKVLYKITSVLAAAALVLSLASCNPEEKVLPSIQQPANASYTSDFGSVSVTWDAVADAGQYQYILKNPLKYTVAKGFVKTNSVTIKSLSPGTTYTLYVKAIPKGVDADTYSASDYFSLETTTAAPKTYDYAWSFPATIWWDYDNPVHKSNKATFGLTKDGKYVIQAWGGVIGMDIVFTLSDKGEWLIDYAESTAYVTGPDANSVVGLAHGIGGTSATTCWFYTNNTGSSFTGNESGGKGEAWMYNPDGDWRGYYFTYGEYVEPEPEPEPIDPDPEVLDNNAEITYNNEPAGIAHVTFDPSTGLYVIDSWFGVEGYGIAFTRDAATGEWVIDPEHSTAYVAGPDSEGYYDMAHGITGKGLYTTCLVPGTIAGSGLKGETLYANILGPDHKAADYVLTIIPSTPSFECGGKIYIKNGDGEEYIGDGVVSYDADTRMYTIHSWFGVEGYDVAFTIVNGQWLLDKEHTTAWLYDEDSNHAIGLANGLTERNCWFYTDNTGSWLEGDEKAGVTGCSMYDHNGVWSQYRIEWKEGDWSAEGTVTVGTDAAGREEIGKATISYSVETGMYTIHNWFGVEGYDVAFTIVDGEWLLDKEHTTAWLYDEDANHAIGLANGLTERNCWFYTNNTGSWLSGNKSAGDTGCWMFDHNGNWSEYKLTW